MSPSTNVLSRIRFRSRAEVRSSPNGFSTTTRAPSCATRLRQLFHDRSEERRRNRQVVCRVLCASELAAERLKGRRVLIVAVDVLKQSGQFGERRTVQASVLLDAFLRPRAQLVERPARLGHADDRHSEVAALGHRLQRGEDLLVCQIARRPEEHERVGVCVAHLHHLLTRGTSWAFSTCPPN